MEHQQRQWDVRQLKFLSMKEAEADLDIRIRRTNLERCLKVIQSQLEQLRAPERGQSVIDHLGQICPLLEQLGSLRNFLYEKAMSHAHSSTVRTIATVNAVFGYTNRHVARNSTNTKANLRATNLLLYRKEPSRQPPAQPDCPEEWYASMYWALQSTLDKATSNELADSLYNAIKKTPAGPISTEDALKLLLDSESLRIRLENCLAAETFMSAKLYRNRHIGLATYANIAAQQRQLVTRNQSRSYRVTMQAIQQRYSRYSKAIEIECLNLVGKHDYMRIKAALFNNLRDQTSRGFLSQ